jgi:hypothetical protein
MQTAIGDVCVLLRGRSYFLPGYIGGHFAIVILPPHGFYSIMAYRKFKDI